MIVSGMSVPQPTDESPVPDRAKRLLILGICSMSLLIVGLDVTIVTSRCRRSTARCMRACRVCSGRSTRTRSCWRAC
jgi:hypothetical protein